MKKIISISLSILLIVVFSLTIFVEFIDEKPKKMSGAYKALKFWNESRAYPFKDISSEKYFLLFS